MKNFREFLLSEEEINYDVGNVNIFVARNINDAKQLLRKNRDFIDELNNKPNPKEYDTEEQRDLVAAAYIVLSKDPEEAANLGLKIDNSDEFGKEVKSLIIDPTRKTANSLHVKTPSMAQVKAYEKKSSASQTDEKPTPEKESAKTEEPKNDIADTEEEPELEEPKEKSTDANTSYDDDEYPNPNTVAKQIEQIQKDAIEKIETLRKENPNRTDAHVVDSAIEKIHHRLNKFAADARKQGPGFNVNPTRMSKIKASNNAKTLLAKAKSEASILQNTVLRKQLPSNLSLTAKRAVETGKSIINKGKEIANSRTAKNTAAAVGRGAKVAGEALKRAAKVAKPIVGRAAELGKEKIKQTMSNIEEKMNSKDIANYLSVEKANEYIDLLRNNKTEEAVKIAEEAKKAKTEALKQKRLDKVQSSVNKRNNKVLKNKATQNVKPSVKPQVKPVVKPTLALPPPQQPQLPPPQ